MSVPNNIPIKIRAVNDTHTGLTEVRILITHPMDTGRLRNEQGIIIPTWHITYISIYLAKIPVLSAQFGTALSKNPYLYFKIKAGVKGDALTVKWVDNYNKSRQDTVSIV